MNCDRREFLGHASALLATSAGVPLFLRQTALAAAATEPTDDRILVVLQLTGGNDGLNTVVPFADDNYRRLRPKLNLADAELHKLDDRLGLHPALEPLAEMFQEGQAAVVQSVGYPHPNRSHFESMAIWHTAPGDSELALGKAAHAKGGWLARALDRRAAPADAATSTALRVGDGEIPEALLGCRTPVPSLADLDQLKRRGGLLDRESIRAQLAGWRASAKSPASATLLAAAQSAVAVQSTADQIEQIAPRRSTGVNYPDYELAGRLRLIAELIRAGFQTSIYYTELAGFDTHSNQLNRHRGLLRQLGRSLKAFVEDVSKHAAGRPLAVLVFSEFGRRASENASGGTDHGTAAPMFLVGNRVAGGIHGPYPDLANLADGDPIHGIDFRQVYATVLEKWLRLDSRAILGQQLDLLPLFNATRV